MPDELTSDVEVDEQLLTDTLVTFLLGACRENAPNKLQCDQLEKDYGACNICADVVLRDTFNYLNNDEQKRVQDILQSVGPPICATKSCPVK
jgi:hypothetical protein